jgi:hypothetical protein
VASCGSSNLPNSGRGKTNLLWQRSDNTLEARVWTVDESTMTKLQDIAIGPSPSKGPPWWQLAGIGDFDHDGKPDLVWRRDNDTLEARVWLMDGANVKPGKSDIGLPLPAPGWRLAGVADFDGDGTPDLIWHPLISQGHPEYGL